MSFWENVDKLRQEQNTSFRWIASVMNVSETTVSSMRKNNTEPRASEAVKVAFALHTTVEYLVTGKDSNPYKEQLDKLKASIIPILTEPPADKK